MVCVSNFAQTVVATHHNTLAARSPQLAAPTTQRPSNREPSGTIARLAEVQDSGSAGGDAGGGRALGSRMITTRERRGLR